MSNAFKRHFISRGLALVIKVGMISRFNFSISTTLICPHRLKSRFFFERVKGVDDDFQSVLVNACVALARRGALKEPHP